MEAFLMIPALSSLFTYLVVSLLSCQFCVTAGGMVFILCPVTLDAPLLLMKS